MSIFGGGTDFGGRGDKALSLSVFETLQGSWADPDLRQRITFILLVFAVFALGVNVQVPIPNVSPSELTNGLATNAFFMFLNAFGGGALRRVSIFALGLNPYITASIILQILSQAMPAWKEELKEGGEYARRAQNKRTRALSLFLCVFQSLGLIAMLQSAIPSHPFTWFTKFTIVLFWTAGSMFVLWLGEQISERGIGNGVSLMIFAGIILSMPSTIGGLYTGVVDKQINILSALGLLLVFLATTWFVVYFTVAQRRIPVQHMRRTQGTRMVGGQTSYLPFAVNMTGVIPLIFAFTIIYLPQQFASMTTPYPKISGFFKTLDSYVNPGVAGWHSIFGCLFFSATIFFFTYFYTAVQYNVDDISDNLKRGGSFIPGVRPGKQTGDFLNGVISKITVVGAAFLSLVALVQFIAPKILGGGLQNFPRLYILGGSTLLIMVSVALETMRQIEANLLMKRYNG